MEKSTLKSALNLLNSDETVTVNFVGGTLEHNGEQYPSGNYTVKSVVTGRGKGGSRLANLEGADGRSLVVGTPNSDKVLSLVVGGTLYGCESQADMPGGFDRDPVRAASLKELFKTLADGSRINMHSTIAELDGEFTVSSKRTLPGRSGQVQLNLVSSDGVAFTVFSYRHSGMIQSVDVL